MARWADAAPETDPIVLFVVSLFASAAVTDDGLASAMWASPKGDDGGNSGPIGLEVVLRDGKCDKENRSVGATLLGDLPRSKPEAEPFPFQKSRLEKNSASRLTVS